MVVKEAIAVAHYIDATGHLPGNYITKIDAKRAGWTGGSVEKIIPGKKIGGDYYFNRNNRLPAGTYHECDIGNTLKNRGPCRLVYSTSGRYYLTTDHYRTFSEIILNPELFMTYRACP